MLKLHDFKCKYGHVTELLSSDKTKTINCPDCYDDGRKRVLSQRMIGTPAFNLKGDGFYKGGYS